MNTQTNTCLQSSIAYLPIALMSELKGQWYHHMLKLFGLHKGKKILDRGIQGKKLISTPFGWIKNEHLNFLC